MVNRRIGYLGALLLCLLAGDRSSGCSCIWSGPFSDVARQTDTIVWGRVLRHQGTSLEFRVAEVLRGSEDRDSIRVWGDNGILCRPYVTVFPVGTEWVFALRKVTPTAGRGSKRVGDSVMMGPVDDPNEEKSDYAISGCGAYYLRATDSLVVGAARIGSTPESQDEIPMGAFRHLVAGLKPDSSEANRP